MAETNLMATIIGILMDSPQSLAAGMAIGFILAKALDRRKNSFGGGF